MLNEKKKPRPPRTAKIYTAKTIDTRTHAFNVGIAMDYSPDMALWLGHLGFWTQNNLGNNKHIHDGLAWCYDTLDALCDQFPYYTRRQIETIINNSVKEGLVQRGNYNQTSYDRTRWYALTPKAYIYFQHLLTDKYLNRLFASISQICEINFTEWCNQFHRSVTPIPDTTPDTDPNNNILADSSNQAESNVFENNENDLKSEKLHEGQTTTSSVLNQEGQLEAKSAKNLESAPNQAPLTPQNTKSDYKNNRPQCSNEKQREEKKKGSTKNLAHYRRDERFMRFYDSYPVKKKGQIAYKAWIKLNPNDELIEKILQDIPTRLTQDSQWRDGFIEHPATYLNEKMWEDEIIDREKIKKTNEEAKKAKDKEEADKRLKAQQIAQEELAKKRRQEENDYRQAPHTPSKAYNNLKELVKRF
jgi:hypothetical protein